MSTATKPTAPSSPQPQLDALIEQWPQGARSVSLKINERLQFEIKDDGSFQILLDLLERLETIAAIQQGLDDVEAGRSMTIDEFKRHVRDKHSRIELHLPR
jgi:hypothetical protein